MVVWPREMSVSARTDGDNFTPPRPLGRLPCKINRKINAVKKAEGSPDNRRGSKEAVAQWSSAPPTPSGACGACPGHARARTKRLERRGGSLSPTPLPLITTVSSTLYRTKRREDTEKSVCLLSWRSRNEVEVINLSQINQEKMLFKLNMVGDSFMRKQSFL